MFSAVCREQGPIFCPFPLDLEATCLCAFQALCAAQGTVTGSGDATQQEGAGRPLVTLADGCSPKVKKAARHKTSALAGMRSKLGPPLGLPTAHCWERDKRILCREHWLWRRGTQADTPGITLFICVCHRYKHSPSYGLDSGVSGEEGGSVPSPTEILHDRVSLLWVRALRGGP